MNDFETRLMVFITKRRLQTTQDDKLVEEFGILEQFSFKYSLLGAY